MSDLRGQIREGDVIGGRYRVTGLLGQGGFGVVYDAVHVTTGHAVAVKLLAERGVGESPAEEMQRRFFQEAATTSRLSHPNTVRVFDFGETEDGNLFLAMERLVGETLQDVLMQNTVNGTTLADGDAANVGIAVLRSLGEAHAHGLVHRDLKPANIFLHEIAGGERIIKVLDFGIVKDIDTSMTQAGKALGTPTHMSPEQAMGTVVDARADIYALGVCLYECVTGVLPFDADNPLAIVMQHVTEPPVPIETRVPGKVRPAIALVIEQALSKLPDERFENAQQMREALQVAISVQPSGVYDVLDSRARANRDAKVAQSVPPSAPTPKSVVARKPSDPLTAGAPIRNPRGVQSHIHTQIRSGIIETPHSTERGEQRNGPVPALSREHRVASDLSAAQPASMVAKSSVLTLSDAEFDIDGATITLDVEQLPLGAKPRESTGEMEPQLTEVTEPPPPVADERAASAVTTEPDAALPAADSGVLTIGEPVGMSAQEVATPPDKEGVYAETAPADEHVMAQIRSATEHAAPVGPPVAAVPRPTGDRLGGFAQRRGGIEQMVDLMASTGIFGDDAPHGRPGAEASLGVMSANLQRMAEQLRQRSSSQRLANHKAVSAMLLGAELSSVIYGTGTGDLRLVRFGDVGDQLIRLSDGSDEVDLGEHSSLVVAIAASLDGQLVVSAGADGAVRAWAPRSGECISSLDVEEGVASLAVSTDAKLCVIGCDQGEVLLAALPELVVTRRLDAHRGAVHACDASSSRRLVVTAGEDGAVRTWDPVGGGGRLTKRLHEGAVASVAVSLDRKWIVSGGWDGNAVVWSVDTGEVLHTIDAHDDIVAGVSIDAACKTFGTVSDDRSARVWNLSDGELITERMDFEAAPKFCRYSEDGRWFFVGAWDGTLRRLPASLSL